jgi:hypothetical protein
VFEDPVLRIDVEKDFILRNKENKISRKQCDENEINLGRLYLLSTQ